MRWLRAFFMVCITPAIFISGCGSMKPEQFAGTQPEFILEDYFLGSTRAWGIFEDRFGDLRRQFVVDITGSWQGDTFVLDERFTYSDGETDQRVWKITKAAPGEYYGIADDVIGTAQGKAAGNALNWQYDLNLKVGDGTWRVHFDDWMFLQPDGILLNRARVSKWGIAIGEVTLAFQRRPDSGAASLSTDTTRVVDFKAKAVGE